MNHKVDVSLVVLPAHAVSAAPALSLFEAIKRLQAVSGAPSLSRSLSLSLCHSPSWVNCCDHKAAGNVKQASLDCAVGAAEVCYSRDTAAAEGRRAHLPKRVNASTVACFYSCLFLIKSLRCKSALAKEGERQELAARIVPVVAMPLEVLRPQKFVPAEQRAIVPEVNQRRCEIAKVLRFAARTPVEVAHGVVMAVPVVVAATRVAKLVACRAAVQSNQHEKQLCNEGI